MHTTLAFLHRLLICAVLAGSLPPATAQDSTAFAIGFSYYAQAFPLVGKGQAAPICVEPGTAKVVSIAATALQHDINEICSINPRLFNQLPATGDYAVLVGTLGNGGWIDGLYKKGQLRCASIAGKWESFIIGVVNQPLPGLKQALVIAGSDARGTAFGVFELSRIMGVSPWTWWADVHPAPHTELYVAPASYIQGPPSVKYRGIFLNDEDWGLQPWAAHKMDTDVHDIGPKTYTRIFELLLRLKANYIWPAMHPCTKAFYYYPDNPRLANDYSIVVGSSHCEPMLRNNVFEWAENYVHEYGNAPGEWRYDHNKAQIYNYWKDRVQQSRSYPSVYTVGMRGIHDGSMPGPAAMPDKVKLMQEIISDQRQLLSNGTGKAPETIPQIFCPYKEVLYIYRNGLSLPDDVTIVWADDNYGYIRQLSGGQEQKRSGRSGVYYHLSYWGAPQDYLWLSSISPSLISYEMSKAYYYGADRVWIFNVGDIKPAEMEIEFSMDLAWNVQRWPPSKVSDYIHDWAARTFGPAYADTIAAIKSTYYQLAQTGKPEHLNSIHFTDAEMVDRLDQYGKLALRAADLYYQMPERLKDAYYELILYPVTCAWKMNQKILYAQVSLRVAAAGADNALVFADMARMAYESIQAMTEHYNDSLAGGKWAGIMSWHPRDQAVFKMPRVATQQMIDSAKATLGNRSPLTGVWPLLVASSAVIIQASTATAKKENASFQTIPGLGAGGNGVTIFPFAAAANGDTALSAKPWLEYKVSLPAGTHTLLVKCLPTEATGSNGLLRYAVSVNGEAPTIVNIHTEAESRPWRENVLRGYATGKSAFTLSTAGPATLRIYFPDPGLVINQLEID